MGLPGTFPRAWGTGTQEYKHAECMCTGLQGYKCIGAQEYRGPGVQGI